MATVTLHIDNVIIEFPSPPHRDIADDARLFAHVIIDEIIFLQTLPVERTSDQTRISWMINFDCKIPPSVRYFSIAIIHVGVKQSTRLLGSVEIGKDTIIRKIEANERFSLKLANVVQDGPVLILTAGFSLASGPQYTYYAAKDNINYLNKSLIVSQLPQMYEAMQSQREIGLLELAVMYERVLLLPNTSRDKSQSLNKLGDIYSRLHSAREKDLYQAVDAYRDAVRVATHGMHDKWEIADYLSDMGISLSRRFECLGNVSDIDEAVLTFRNAVQLTSYDNPNKALSFDNLGRALMYRFNHLGNVSDINESVQLFSDAVRLTPVDDPEQFFSLNHLGRALMYRFTRLGNLNDINESIVMLQEAVRLIPDWHPERAAQLDDLGGALGYRFKYLGNLSDLEKSIQLQQDAVKLTPDGHPDRAQTLNNFSSSLARHFWHVGNVNDIDNSIIMKQEVLDLTPDGHPSKPGYMKDLANSLLYRFLRLAKHSDIDKSVLLLQNAVQLTPDDYPGKPGYFNMLGASLQSRFVVLGKLSDINESILMLQNAVQLIPDDHPEKPRFLNDLGTAFLHRFRYFGNLNDINETVLIFEDVVKLAPDSHPDRSLWLNNLGGSLSDRFSRLHNISDLEKCILMFQNSVKLIPDNHPAKPQLLNNLGGSLIQHFQHAGHISDIEQSIQVLKDAVKLTPDDHPIKPSQLGNLGNSLLCRFHCLGNISDIDESILIVQDAVKLSPDNHPHKPGLLETLGNVWFHRFEQLHINQDASQALDCYSSAAQAATGPASTRFSASSQWVFLAEKIGHESCLEAYSTVLTLLPQLAWLGSPVPDRHFHIRKAGALVRQAAVATIEQDDFSTAIEWLEQGRAVIWGQLLNLRAPIDDLKISHPDLGLQLEHLSSQLEGATTQSTLVQPLSGPYSAASQPLDYHRLAEKREQLLTSIRQLPGFEQFLLPRPLTQLTKAAKWGPVIMLNASERRCDALVLMSGLSDDILHIPLPDVSLAKAMALHKILKDLLKGCIPTADRLLDSSENTDWKRLGIYFVSTETGQPYKDILVEWSRIVLSLLWHWVVKPIVEGLALTTSEPCRIWWCPTGIFSFLPLHAAGDYSQNAPLESRLDAYAISSYTPSLTSLIQVIDLHLMAPAVRMLAVGQSSFNGQAHIPGVQEELRFIREQAEKNHIEVIQLTASGATASEVKKEITTANWVHFACHGVQNSHKPTESALLLAGTSKLTLSEIITMKLPSRGLAFLSACQTATGDEDLSDEAVHLAAGMLSAGYQGVIATMWSIDDRHTPQVANDVYEYLFQNTRPNATDAAIALHYAVKNLREKQDLKGKRTMSPLIWVPFIHVGL